MVHRVGRNTLVENTNMVRQPQYLLKLRNLTSWQVIFAIVCVIAIGMILYLFICGPSLAIIEKIGNTKKLVTNPLP
jgi:type III secretory pathway component EscT